VLIAPAVASGQSVDQCVPIAYGDLISDKIGVLGELDLYCLEGNAGEIIIIQMISTTNIFLGCFLELYDPAGALIKTAAGARIDITLPMTGTYTIIARDNGNDDTGGYNLALEQIYPNPSCIATIDFGDLISEIINPLGELDLYCFGGNAGDIIVIQMISTTNIFLGCFLELYDPTGILIKTASGARIDITLPITGIYLVVARDNGNDDTGGYNLTLERVFTPFAEICGVVTDAEGNPLSGVQVMATNIDTQEKTRVKTDGNGFYVISDLDPGKYRLLCIKQGYKLAVKKVEAPPNEKTTVDFVLQLK